MPSPLSEKWSTVQTPELKADLCFCIKSMPKNVWLFFATLEKLLDGSKFIERIQEYWSGQIKELDKLREYVFASETNLL